jgi:hypothetical protein
MELLISSTGCLRDVIIHGYGKAFGAGERDTTDKTQNTIDKDHWKRIKRTLNESFKPLVLGATPVASRLRIFYDFIEIEMPDER